MKVCGYVSFRYPHIGSNSSSHQTLKRLTLNPLVTILGDISAAEYLFEYGQTVVSVVVYISLNQREKNYIYIATTNLIGTLYVNVVDLNLKAYLPGTGVILDQEGGSPEQRNAIALGWVEVRHNRKLRLLGVHNFW
ncbi:hypothetical protein TNCV_4217701 [Trichonephila clavipes]|nr:hypothetical protein TNCV_4217701 [Trichonephila clavipes]